MIFEGHLGKGECRGSGVNIYQCQISYWEGHVAAGMICSLPHQLPRVETLLMIELGLSTSPFYLCPFCLKKNPHIVNHQIASVTPFGG